MSNLTDKEKMELVREWAERNFTYWKDDPDDPEYEVVAQELPWSWDGKSKRVLFLPMHKRGKNRPGQYRKMPRPLLRKLGLMPPKETT